MKALCYIDKQHVAVQEVRDPAIINPRDAVVRITTTAICGSDLHLYGGFVPHEIMARWSRSAGR